MNINTIIFGGKGMLGVELAEALAADSAFNDVIVGDLPEIDITSDHSLNAFLQHKHADVIFNCAAYTNVDACEQERDLAFAVNGAAAGRLAVAAAAMSAHFIHVSTDFVFNGAKSAPYLETDPPDPLSVYGKSKLDGEKRVATAGGKWAVARTAWLYGGHKRNFVTRMLEMARERDSLVGVTDQTGSPTWTRDLAAALIAIAKTGATGIFHTVNAGACSRYEQILFILQSAGLRVSVEPIETSAFPRPARVPSEVKLCTEKLTRETGHHMRPWKDALAEYIGQLTN